MATIRGHCLFILLRAPDCAATIQGRCLLKEIQYHSIAYLNVLGWARLTYVYKPSFPDVLNLFVDGWHQFFDKGLLDVAQDLVCSHHKLLLHSWHEQHAIIRTCVRWKKKWCTSLTSNVSHLPHWKFHCGLISHSFSTCRYVYLHKIVWLLHERGHNYTNITFLLGSQNSTAGVERSFWFGRDDIGDLCPLYTKTPKPPPFPAPINYVGIRKKVDWQENIPKHQHPENSPVRDRLWWRVS